MMTAGLNRVRESGTKSGRPVKGLRVVFRRDQAAELRPQGLSWAQVARTLGVSIVDPAAARELH